MKEGHTMTISKTQTHKDKWSGERRKLHNKELGDL